MINSNTKVWLFIIASSLVLLVTGYEIGERLGLLFAFLVALVVNFFVFYYGESRVLSQLQAQRLQGQDAWGLLEIVARLADQLQVPPPAVFVTPHTSVNAFCVGHSWRPSSLCFTAGLLKSLNRQELEAVAAYQLCHSMRFETFVFSVANTVANAIVGLGQFLDSALPYKLQFFRPLLSPLGWVLVKAVSFDRSVFENDLLAAKILNDRSQLGHVLWRLEGLAATRPLTVPPCTKHLFIVRPDGSKPKSLFLKSHPEIEVRLQKLMGYYPI